MPPLANNPALVTSPPWRQHAARPPESRCTQQGELALQVQRAPRPEAIIGGGEGSAPGLIPSLLSPPFPAVPPLPQGQVLFSHQLFLPTPFREPSELQGVGALEATSWALKMAEHELGITPVLSAQAVVSRSDPLGLIAYLSHFHSAFKSTPHNPGDLEGRQVGQAWGKEVHVWGGGEEEKRERGELPLQDSLGEVSFIPMGWHMAVL